MEELIFNPDVVLTEKELDQVDPPPKSGSFAYKIDEIMGDPTEEELDEFFDWDMGSSSVRVRP
tara:strand:- start:300 stop:488 length:189 start_codon:yes stop_codon:yes gene_type:complete